MTKNTSESTKELPNGWEWKKLKNVCEKITDGTHQTPTYFDEGVIFLSSKNVTSGKIDWDNVKYIDTKQHIEMHKRVAPRLNDILLAKNGTTGVAAMVDRDVIFDIYVSLAFLRPLNTILPNYLLHYINSPQAKNQFNGRLKGAGVPNLHLEEIREVEIPLPPLKEQERIVQKLDTAFQSLDEAITLQKENIAHTQELKKAVLEEAFLNESFKIEKLGDVVKFEGGSQPAKDEFLYEYKEGYIRLLQIRDYKSDKHIVYINKKSARRFCIKTDVMIGRYGPPVFQILRGLEGAYNVALMKAIPKYNTLTNDYLFWFLQNGKIQNYVIGLSQRSAGQSGVDKVALEKFQIPIPPLPEQERIVANLETIFTKLDALIVEQEARLAQLMELKKSVLQEAFDGKL